MYEIVWDKEGIEGIRDMVMGKFFYNLEIIIIEERFVNGYYVWLYDFYKDINRFYLDVKNIGDKDRIFKVNELRINVEVDVYDISILLVN